MRPGQLRDSHTRTGPEDKRTRVYYMYVWFGLAWLGFN